MNKKFLLSLAVCLLASSAFAETRTYSCGENCTATIDDDYVMRIFGTGAMDDYQDFGVGTTYTTSPWSDERARVKTVIVEDGITYLGQSAFRGFSSLKDIEIAGSVETVGAGSFDEIRPQRLSMSDTTLWLNQDDMYDLQNLTVYCKGNYSTCKQNFLKNSPKLNQHANEIKFERSQGKKIYTVEEATKASKATGNRFKIRYK